MLGILLLYFIGKPFYELAEQYNKSKWGFAILSVVVYYAGTFVTGIILAILFPDSIENMNNILLSLLAVPLGLLFAWLLYSYLKKSWSKSPDNYGEGDILDQNLDR